MVKKFKGFKITAILTMLCVCIAYFSLLSPTTAYFYESKSTNKEIQFDLFDVRQTLLTANENFEFYGATKFSDFSELLFDKVAYQMTIRVTNEGAIPARVYVRITDTNDDGTANEGLHYIPFFDYEEATDSGVPQSELTKGALKQKIESTLAEYNSDFIDGIGQEDALVILNAYNTSIYKVLEAGQSTDITIVFWVEYGEVESTLSDTSELTRIDYSKNVSVIATQNNDAATV